MPDGSELDVPAAFALVGSVHDALIHEMPPGSQRIIEPGFFDEHRMARYRSLYDQLLLMPQDKQVELLKEALMIVKFEMASQGFAPNRNNIHTET